jgi:hypothetical protein
MCMKIEIVMQLHKNLYYQISPTSVDWKHKEGWVHTIPLCLFCFSTSRKQRTVTARRWNEGHIQQITTEVTEYKSLWELNSSHCTHLAPWALTTNHILTAVVVTASGTEHTTHKNEAKAEVMHGTLHARNTATPSTSLTYLHGARSSVNCSMKWSTTEPKGSSSLLPSHEVKQFNSVQFLSQERVSVHPV